MNRYIASILFILLTLPFSLHAEDIPETPREEVTPPPSEPVPEPILEPIQAPIETIHVTLNIRYKGSLISNNNLTLNKGQKVDISDKTGTLHSIDSDSALEALVFGNTNSNEFNLSDLSYYADYGSFLVNCIYIDAISQNACGNWQYVVNSAFPMVGADKLILHDGDTLYFFFGSPRKVSVPVSTVEAGTPFLVTAESYDYTNDTWKPLSGAQIGVTQENPNDPYSPIVLQTSTTDGDGKVSFSIQNTGTYSVGIASDYYYPSELITINPQISRGSGGTSPIPIPTTDTHIATSSIATTSPIIELVQATEPIVLEQETIKDVLITLDVSIEDFTKRYKEFSARPPVPVFVYTEPQKEIIQNTATVLGAFETSSSSSTTTSQKENSWYTNLLHVLGF